MMRLADRRSVLSRLGCLAGGMAASGLAVFALLAWLQAATPGAQAARPAAGQPAPAAVTAAADSLQLTVRVEPDPDCRALFSDEASAVCNGQVATYTLIVTNVSGAPLTSVQLINALPVDPFQKPALLDPAGDGHFRCSDGTPGVRCSTIELTQTILSPVGDPAVLSVTTQLVWQLGAVPDQAQRAVSFVGIVAGQSDGTLITNRATAVASGGAAVVHTTLNTVRVLPLVAGGPSLASFPTWFSEDLGGTYHQDWADFDRSGKLSLALGAANGVSVYRYRDTTLERVGVANALDPNAEQPAPAPAYGVRWADVLPDAGNTLELVAVGVKDVFTGTNAIGGEGGDGARLPAESFIYQYQAATNSFVEVASFTTTQQLVRVVAADFTGDGRQDLVVSNNAIGSAPDDPSPCAVLLLRNTGDLARPFRYAPPDTSTWKCLSRAATAALAVGDLDDDGLPDLVLGVFPNRLGMILNQSGAFTSPAEPVVTIVDEALSYLPYDLALADFDRDGRQDLAAAYPLQREARLYRNTSTGPTVTFAISKTLRTAIFLTPLAVDWGDFDGDTTLDLAVTDATPRIYLNEGGRFERSLPISAIPGQSQLWSLRAVRPQTRANPELALTNSDGPSMLYSAFTPHLSPTLTRVGGEPAASVAWGATGPEGWLDLVFGALGLSGRTELYRNDAGRGTFARASQLLDDGPVHASLVDVNGDTRLELARGTLVQNSICQLLIQGATTTPINCASSSDPPFIRHVFGWGDVNGDGWLDLMVGSQGGPLVLFRNTAGVLGATPTFTIQRGLGQPRDVRAIAWSDWALSRYPGFAVAFFDGAVELYRNNRDGTFSLAQSLPVSRATGLAWANFNANPAGYPSLAVSTDRFGTVIFENTAGQLSATPVYTTETVSRTTSLAWGDWDLDGFPDLALGNDGEPAQVYVNDGSTPGTPRLAWAWSSAETYSATAVSWGDATGDSFPELAVSAADGVNGYYLNTTVVPTYVTTIYPAGGPAPESPLFVRVTRPGRTAPSNVGFAASEVLLIQPPFTSVVPVTYQVFGPAPAVVTAANLAPNTLLQVSLDGGVTWQTAMTAPTIISATPVFTPTVVTQSLPTGNTGVFYWDAVANRAISDDARFRVIVAPLDSPSQSAVGVSPPFRIRAVSCRWPRDAGILVSDDTPAIGQRVYFTGTLLSGGGVMTYSWNFGDGGPPAVGQAVQRVFSTAGDFTVRLTVSGQVALPNCYENAYTAAQRLIRLEAQRNWMPVILQSARLSGPAAAQAGAAEPAARRAAVAAGPADAGGPEAAQAAETAQAVLPDIFCDEDLTADGSLTSTLVLSGVTGVSLPPTLNESGAVVAFASAYGCQGGNADGNIEVFVARVGPGPKLRITQVTSSTGGVLGGFNLGPSINAAGTRVAFFSDRDLLGENLSQSRLAFQVYVADLDPETFKVIRLTRVTTDTRSANVFPVLDRSGEALAFISDSRELADNDAGVPQVVRADLRSITGTIVLTQVTRTAGVVDQPAISPDGAHIAFLLDGRVQLWSAATGNVREITAPGARSYSAPSLSEAPAGPPGAVRVAFLFSTNGSPELAFADVAPGAGAVLAQPLAPAGLGVPLAGGRPGLGDGGQRLGLLSRIGDTQASVVYDFPQTRVITDQLPAQAAVALAGFNRGGTRLAFVAGDALYLANYPFVNVLTVTQAISPAIPVADLSNPENRILYTAVVSNSGPMAVESVTLTVAISGVGGLVVIPNPPVNVTDTFAVTRTGQVFTNTLLTGDQLLLAPGAAQGLYQSPVLTGLATGLVGNWERLQWTQVRPTSLALPDGGVAESGYLTGNVDMLSNTLLLHLDGQPGVISNGRSFADTSGAGLPGVFRCFSGSCPSFGVDGRYQEGLLYDGVFNYLYLDQGRLVGYAANGSNRPLAVEMWFRTTGVGALYAYRSYFTYNGVTRFDSVPALYIGTDGRLRGLAQFGCPYFQCDPAFTPAAPNPLTSPGVVNDNRWHHVVLVGEADVSVTVTRTPTMTAESVSGLTLRLYLDGQPIGSTQGLVLAAPPGAISFMYDEFLGISDLPSVPWPFLPAASPYPYPSYGGQMDEVAFYARALTADEVRSRYLRGAQRLTFQVRACDEPADGTCLSSAPFVGPDGTAGTYYADSFGLEPGVRAITLTTRPFGRFFQYQALLENEAPAGDAAPLLASVSASSGDVSGGFVATQGGCEKTSEQAMPSTTGPDITATVVTCGLGMLPAGQGATFLAGIEPTQWGPFEVTAVFTPTGLLFNRANPDAVPAGNRSVLAEPVRAVTITDVVIQAPAALTVTERADFTIVVTSNAASPKFHYNWSWEGPGTLPPAAGVVGLSFSQVAPITPETAGLYTLTTVVTNSAAALTRSLAFTVPNLALSGLVLNPASVVTGTVGSPLNITITGNGLEPNTEVTWNGNNISESCNSPCTTLTAVVPLNRLVLGANTVVIFNDNGPPPTEAFTTTFTVNAPTLTLTPADATLVLTVGTQTTATITANLSHAQLGARAVTLSPSAGGLLTLPTSAPTFAPGVTQTTFVVTATGIAGDLTLTGQLPANIGGDQDSVAIHLQHAPPVLNSLLPGSATAGQAGFDLRINGSNFAPGAEAFWDGSPLTGIIIANGGTVLTGTVSAAQIGLTARTVNITVTNPSPNLGPSNGLLLNVNAPTLSMGPNPLNIGVGQAGQFTLQLSAAQAADRQVTVDQDTSVNTFLDILGAPVTLPAALPSNGFSVVGLMPGSTTVTATLAVMPSVTASASVTVVQPTLTLSLEPAGNLGVGSNALVRATISHVQAADRDITLTVGGNPASITPNPLPASVTLPGGSASVTFGVTGAVTGSVTITGQLPAAAGGGTSNTLTITVP